MSCETIRFFLYRFAENALLEDDAHSVHEHVNVCEHCRRRLEHINQLDEAIAGIEDEHPSPQLRQRILENYRSRMRSQRPFQVVGHTLIRLRRVAAVLLIACVSSAATWLLVRSPDHPHQPVIQQRIVQLDKLFPLSITTPFTIVDDDAPRS